MKIISLMLCIFLVGCATVGTKIDASKLSQIKENVTTKAEVENILGKPQSISLTSDGKTLMMYQYVKASSKGSNFVPVVNLFSGGMNMNMQIIQVLIGKDDKVEKYILNDSANDIKTGLLN